MGGAINLPRQIVKFNVKLKNFSSHEPGALVMDASESKVQGFFYPLKKCELRKYFNEFDIVAKF